MDAEVGKAAGLRNGLALQVGRPQVGERIAAGEVVELVLAHKRAGVHHGIGVHNMRPGGRNVEGAYLRSLVRLR